MTFFVTSATTTTTKIKNILNKRKTKRKLTDTTMEYFSIHVKYIIFI